MSTPSGVHFVHKPALQRKQNYSRVSLKMNHAGNHGLKRSLSRVMKPLLHLSSKKMERRLGKFAGVKNICISLAFVYIHIYLYICI